MYVDYVYYIGEYGGTLIPENSFKSFERKSESYIRQLTYVRGDIFAQKDDVVKDAVCAVAEVSLSDSFDEQADKTPAISMVVTKTSTISLFFIIKILLKKPGDIRYS